MTDRPVVLSPATPSELLSYITRHCRYPTTLLVGSSKSDFITDLAGDVWPRAHEPSSQDEQALEPDPAAHPLLKATLMQIAVSRHIRVAFVPTVVHLRAYLATFSAADSKVSAPPPAASSTGRGAPLLLVYGLLELHRGASEWSAQGIGDSAAVLVEAAAGSELRAVVVEPRSAGGHESLEQVLGETLPLLGGTSINSDGSWSGRGVEMRRVLRRWFGIQEQERPYGAPSAEETEGEHRAQES